LLFSSVATELKLLSDSRMELLKSMDSLSEASDGLWLNCLYGTQIRAYHTWGHAGRVRSILYFAVDELQVCRISLGLFKPTQCCFQSIDASLALTPDSSQLLSQNYLHGRTLADSDCGSWEWIIPGSP